MDESKLTRKLRKLQKEVKGLGKMATITCFLAVIGVVGLFILMSALVNKGVLTWAELWREPASA